MYEVICSTEMARLIELTSQIKTHLLVIQLAVVYAVIFFTMKSFGRR